MSDGLCIFGSKRKKKPLLRSLCTYTLLVALTLQSFYRLIMTLEYQIHLPDYVEKCINKDNPELECNGHCMLIRKISEKEKEETKKNQVAYEYSSLYVHRESDVFKMYQPKEEFDQSLLLHYEIDYRFSYHTSLFRPPIA